MHWEGFDARSDPLTAAWVEGELTRVPELFDLLEDGFGEPQLLQSPVRSSSPTGRLERRGGTLADVRRSFVLIKYVDLQPFLRRLEHILQHRFKHLHLSILKVSEKVVEPRAANALDFCKHLLTLLRQFEDA
jgi:hypothetical protein